MTTPTDGQATATDDPMDHIRDLRARLDALLAERVEPGVKAATAATGRLAADELETLATLVRARPLTALAAACALGFVIARITR